ncbi:hypothetical protein ACWERY_13860 [Streptomyces sp. NPDC004082]|uniref:hypothetical protein n=1 Tax=unclassified Streptomyces TaxID=2593676 RepID=UPI0033B3B3AE
MTDDEMLLGFALTVVLATGSQILANRLRVPAPIVLFPAGFAVGATTDVVHPDKLLGPDLPDQAVTAAILAVPSTEWDPRTTVPA